VSAVRRWPTRLPLPPRWTLAYYLALLAALATFAEVARTVYRQGGFGLDAPLLGLFHEAQHPLLNALAHALDLLGVAATLGLATALLAAWLWPRSRRSSLFLLLGFWGAVSMNLATKAVFARERPDLFEALVSATNYAFPSGHAMGSLAFALSLHVVAGRLWPRRRLLISTLLLAFAGAVGLSRLYLQVHYPSDVLAGWALSAAWVAGLSLWYRRRFERSRGAGEKQS
jgi:membrane-associated phospholipid phosphatase